MMTAVPLLPLANLWALFLIFWNLRLLIGAVILIVLFFRWLIPRHPYVAVFIISFIRALIGGRFEDVPGGINAGLGTSVRTKGLGDYLLPDLGIKVAVIGVPTQQGRECAEDLISLDQAPRAPEFTTLRRID